MVRLLHGMPTPTACRTPSFNPTMVRLLPALSKKVIPKKQRKFQSHNGAIAAIALHKVLGCPADVSIPQWCDCCSALNCCKDIIKQSFNPTMVRLLPRPQRHQPAAKFGRFNPTMVRLLHDYPSPKTVNGDLFQSHNGAIAASVTQLHSKGVG